MRTGISLAVLLGCLYSLVACGGQSSQYTSTPPPASYTIGGSVAGLSGSGLVLQDNGGNNLSLNPNQTSFVFPTPITSGGTYSVTVLTQPSNPAQTCTIVNGSGTATASVNTVALSCMTAKTNEWTWVSGPNTMGDEQDTDSPSARSGAAGWIDRSGNIWIFGGDFQYPNGQNVFLNDFWEYSAGTWTAINSSNVVPEERSAAATWSDSSGNLWLFGGLDAPAHGAGILLSDLWEYSNGQWIEVNVSGDVPGARYGSLAWTDKSGNFWLWGGNGFPTSDQSQAYGLLNDMWEFSGGKWSLINGSSVTNQPGAYGTLGKAAKTNIPGSRYYSVSWIDQSGNLWLFGGSGLDSKGAGGSLNDLWKYSAGQWTWMGGPNVANQPANYGSQGVTAAANLPGARWGSVGWTDSSGTFWLFGGTGIGSTSSDIGVFNDLWKFSAGTWTWVGGANQVDPQGSYGTLGVPDPGNVPGGRNSALSLTDASGNFWLFGGIGVFAGDPSFGDLWEYLP